MLLLFSAAILFLKCADSMPKPPDCARSAREQLHGNDFGWHNKKNKNQIIFSDLAVVAEDDLTTVCEDLRMGSQVRIASLYPQARSLDISRINQGKIRVSGHPCPTCSPHSCLIRSDSVSPPDKGHTPCQPCQPCTFNRP